MGQNRVDDLRILSKAASQVGAEFGVVLLALAFDSLADIMQQAGAQSQLAVRTDFAGDRAGEDGDFLAVVQHVLAIARPEVESSKGPDHLLTDIVDAKVEDHGLALVHDHPGNLLRDLLDHFLDASRMDASVLDQSL